MNSLVHNYYIDKYKVPLYKNNHKVDRLLNRFNLQNELNTKLKSCKTKEERIEFVDSIRSDFGPISRLILNKCSVDGDIKILVLN